MSLKKQESVKLLKEELSKILIKNHIIDRYSISSLDRGGAENFLRGCGWSHTVKSNEILDDLVDYIKTGYYKKPKRKT